jgi:hypothetical protein
MSSDLIGRRRASEQRLDRARALEQQLKDKTEVLVQTTGMPIEQLDFDGSFRAALTALAGVASRRPQFDVIVTLPDAPFAMRIQHVNNAVSAQVLIQRDGPFEPVSAPTPTYSTSSSPVYSAAATPAYPGVVPGVVESEYATAEQEYSESPAPAYAEPGYAEPGYAEPGYAEPGYAEPVYPEPAYAASSGAEYSSGTDYSGAGTDYAGSAVAAVYSGSSAPSATPSGSTPASGGSGTARPGSTADPTGVASDLAALLWQGVDDMPS